MSVLLLLHRAPVLFKRDPSNLRLNEILDRLAVRTGPPRIRCPACRWEPKREDLWMCVCLYSWNTFDTGGVCPSCDRRWTETQCPKCHVWSKHEDWYARDDEEKK